MPNIKPLQKDFKGLTDWVEIFRAGKFDDSKGRPHEFTQADLDTVIANHDPKHPPRHVITHKEMYSPFSYGDAYELKREGDLLFAKSANIEPGFENLVKTGRLPERSIRLLPAENGWKLGHIAWLGAEPPAVEGMAPVTFSAADQGFDFAIDSQTPHTLVRMMRNMREFLIENFSKEQADEVMPGWEIDSLDRHANELENENTPEFQKQTGDDMSITQQELDAAVKKAGEDAALEFSKKETTLQTQLNSERETRNKADFQSIVSAHVVRGVPPATMAGVVDFMMQFSQDEDAGFEFSQGDPGKEQVIKTTPLDFVKSLLDKIPATVSTKKHEFTHDDVDADDAQSIAIAASEFRKKQSDKGIDISITAAVQHVSSGGAI